MANIKSQIKRNRQNERRRTRNLAVRSRLKTEATKVRAAARAGDLDTARERLQIATRDLDRAVSKGVLDRRTAARRKSRLARAVAEAAKPEAPTT